MKQVRHIGIDISDASVKVLSLNEEGEVFAYGHTPLPQGAVQEGRIVDGAAFAVGLRAVLAKTKPNVLSNETLTLTASVSIPESKLFTHAFDVPADIAEHDIETFVNDAAGKIIPVSLSELYTTVCVEKRGEQQRATFAGAYTRDVEMIVNGCVSAGVKPTLMCGEMFSISQSLLPQGYRDVQVIIDIGAHTTTIGFFGSGHTEELSISVPFAGIFFSESIARILGISLSEAETKKRNYGLDVRYETTKVPGILRECVGEIIRALKEAQLYVEKKCGVRVTHCILTGGSSHTPGIVEVIAEHTGLTVTQGDPMKHVNDHGAFMKNEPGFLYANVIGLARMGHKKELSCMNLLTNYAWHTQTKRHSEVAGEAWKRIATSLGVVEQLVRRLKTRLHHEKASFGIRAVLTILFAFGSISFLVWVILKYT